MTGRERITLTVRGEQTDSLPLIPISMMIAADQAGVCYRQYVLDAAAHARGQIAFAERYDVDHVSAISCPTTEAADLGAAIIYYENQPPAVDESNALLQDKSRLRSLNVPDPGSGPRMSKRLEVISRLKTEVGDQKLVEGWVEGPIAESCDLRGINTFMMDLYDDEGFVRDLFDFVFEMEMTFARAQIAAGADIIGVGDAAASLAGPKLYRAFIWEYQKRYVQTLHEMGALVRLHICGNTTPLLAMLREVGADILDLDSMVALTAARRETGPRQLLSGNIDPVRALRDGTPESVYRAFQECYDQAGGSCYAVNAGCEVPRDTPAENIDAMRRFARENRARPL
ncbi:MAG: uroporphyrinogen decarboxylase [Spirochaetaceae bacterium]|nr:MAG: uroporphyrinogen decarboxylase [Spirochaetaceae bacterium]